MDWLHVPRVSYYVLNSLGIGMCILFFLFPRDGCLYTLKHKTTRELVGSTQMVIWGNGAFPQRTIGMVKLQLAFAGKCPCVRLWWSLQGLRTLALP